jgi:hypothetical protein
LWASKNNRLDGPCARGASLESLIETISPRSYEENLSRARFDSTSTKLQRTYINTSRTLGS